MDIITILTIHSVMMAVFAAVVTGLYVIFDTILYKIIAKRYPIEEEK